MSQVMFSDDDDVSKHAAELERIHEAISTHEPSITPCDTEDCKENQFSDSYLDKDPVYRRILQDRERPLRDVFILPFVPPSKSHNEYEFGSDQDSFNERSYWSPSVGSRPSSTASCDAYRYTSSQRSNSSLSASPIPLADRRRRRRLQKLRDAVIAARSTASDDDQEFVPGLCDFEALLRDQETVTMKLRPRKELWNADDDLPLADVQLQVVLEQSEKETKVSDIRKRSTEECLSTKVSSKDSDDTEDFAYLPSSLLCTSKDDSRRKHSRFDTPSAGTCGAISIRNLKATHIVPSRRAPLRASRRGNCARNVERRLSDSDLDLPLSHFVDSSDGTGRCSKSGSAIRRKRARGKNDEDYEGSDTEVPLSEIRRRYRSIRWSDKLKRRRIDYSGMDLDVD